MMNTALPPVIAAFFRAHNTGETADFIGSSAGVALSNIYPKRNPSGRCATAGTGRSRYVIGFVFMLSRRWAGRPATAHVSGNFPGSRLKFATGSP